MLSRIALFLYCLNFQMKQILYFLFLQLLIPLARAQEIVLPAEGNREKVASIHKPKVERDDWNKYYEYPKAVKKEKYNIAVLTPLFLDSVDLSKTILSIPKFMMPGIDFYQGVEIAADTLRNKGFHFDIHVFDSKSTYLNVQNLIESDKLELMDLIIGNAGTDDLEILANYAKKKEINFISAVSPSDAGQTFNPFFTILQPQLESHIQEIHRRLMQRYSENNVVFIYGDKEAEKNALDYFKNDDIHSLPVRFSEYYLPGDDLDFNNLKSQIDTNYQTVIVLAKLSPRIAYKIMKSLLPYAVKFNIKIFGMPTLELINTFNDAEEFPGMKIFYSTSFVKENLSPATKYINSAYYNKMKSAPSDLVYKGFESIYFFAHLMDRYGVPFNKYIGENRFSFLTPYKILPVKENTLFKYYENKFLYMLSYENGVMTYE